MGAPRWPPNPHTFGAPRRSRGAPLYRAGGLEMLGVVATLKVKAGMEKDFEAVAKELVAKVNANEAGCKLYALHTGDAPSTYYFMERYTDQTAVEAHRAADYFKDLGRKMGAFMDGKPEVLRLREVE